MNPEHLERILLYGSVESRRKLAETIGGSEGADLLMLLVGSVRSNDALVLRARCLEVLGWAAGEGTADVAAAILAGVISS